MRTATTQRLISGSILDEQVQLEAHAIREGALRYRRLAQQATERGDAASLKPAQRMLLHWLKPLSQAIRAEKRACRRGKRSKGRGVYGQVIQCLDADRMAVITMHEALSACLADPTGALVVSLTHAIGRAVVGEINLDTLRKTEAEQVRKLDRRFKNVTPVHINWWAKKQLENPLWSRQLCNHLGARLMWLLIETASANDYDKPFRLAFHHHRRAEGGKTPAYLRLDDQVLDLIEEGHRRREYLRPRYMPMIVPPYPWTPDAEGGYVRVRTPFISKPTQSQKQALKAAKLDRVHEAINAINATPWRINRRILEVVETLWESGGGLAAIPHLRDFPMPPEVDSTDPAVIKANKAERAATWDKNIALKGQRKDFLEKLGVARQMANHPAIYYPHQMDFRGRSYPIPAHLNHQGDGVCRGLLEFAEPRPVTDRALYWLAVHLANSCGVEKIPRDQQVAWVRDNTHVFAGWTADPLNNTGWMLKPDGKPNKHAFEALAAAYALTAPEAAAHLPVQMDGTCNGLQHYAAMGRDAIGGAAVNLMPSDYPQDIYAKVAEAVRPHVTAAAAAGVEEAAWVAGYLNRDTIKTPVMTSVYGVTMVGARDQVYDALDEAGMEDARRYRASMYLSRVVLDGIGAICPAARAIMDWLTACARLITREAGDPVSWTTPLGLPVVQPYRNYKPVDIRTCLQELRIIVEDESVPVKAGKQIDAFAPNFVHSIDATHMMMTATEMRERGLAFAAVHDSFWTHAADVDEMNHVLREQFVKLHSRPILSDLHRDFAKRYPGLDFPPPPPPGDLNLAVVMDSEYTFM